MNSVLPTRKSEIYVFLFFHGTAKTTRKCLVSICHKFVRNSFKARLVSRCTKHFTCIGYFYSKVLFLTITVRTIRCNKASDTIKCKIPKDWFRKSFSLFGIISVVVFRSNFHVPIKDNFLELLIK